MNKTKAAKMIAIAALIRAKAHPGRPGITVVRMDDEYGAPAMTLTIAQGIAHIGELARATREVERLVKGTQMCKYCGCTDEHACPGGCSWLGKDRCSHPECIERYEQERAAAAMKRRAQKKARQRCRR